MTETEFRAKHSELIAYYQYIESHLKGLWADFFINEDNDVWFVDAWAEKRKERQSDSLWMLIKKLKDLQEEKNVLLLCQEDFDSLTALRKTRNYWVHECFGGDDPIVFRDGKLRRLEYAEKLCSDLDDAIAWDDKLARVARALRNRLT